ncbi:hypothetical protein SLS58_001652 [Diplodia intermedia]|uniref:Carrier domain-containing protein n=1 Tax=Diplodia intermedia TaxID=856260 RepID=A0ABR3U1Q4_9PEZI
MDEISPGVHECVALSSLPSLSGGGGAPSNGDDPPGSFRTRDLFARHPTRPDWWRYLTRLDDRLTLTNGEKVLPLPMEGAVRRCARVAEAVVFGAGRAVPGMLVFRGEGEGEGEVASTAEEFVEAIWGHVEGANAGAESFARIPKELVVAMPAGTEWPRTDKGTAVRQRVYDVFADVIEAAYARFEQTGLDRGQHGGPLLGLEVAELEGWLLEKFRGELGARLQSAEADIFAAGVDSLQTMRMWSLIRKTLDLGPRRDELSQNVVYEKGNVKTLARHLYALRTGEAMDQSDEDELLAMQELVEEFSAFDKHIPGDLPAPDGEVVVSSPSPPQSHPIPLTPPAPLKLLTGATGGLGAHILHALLTHHRTTPLWTALPYTDLSLPNLSIPPRTLAALRACLTCVVHAAWPVNFTPPVRAFRPHAAGLHALLDRLCLRVRTPAPAALLFASSVSATGGLVAAAAQNDNDDDVVVRVPEAVPRPFAAAQGMGYGRSKLVGEKIVAAAARTGGMRMRARARVLRIGQLVGDLGGAGDWNGTEAVPLLVRGVGETGVLPALDENMSWLPIDVAAASILDIALPVGGRESGGGVRDVVEDDAATVYHILNPQTFHWTRDFIPALRRTGMLPPFEVVSPAEWLEKLRDSDPDVQKNPSRKLLGFWEGKYGQEATGKKTLKFQTEKTLEMAPRLGEVPMADILRSDEWLGRVVRRWVSSW